MPALKQNAVARPPRTTPPNATGVHLHQVAPAKIRSGGLHAIDKAAKHYGKKPSPAAQQHANERLAIATSTAPWCNSTTPRNYRAPELSSPPPRPIGRAHQLPSRVGARLFYPDGRVTTLDGHPVKAAP